MSEETKIVYFIGEETCPYVIKIHIKPGEVTLKDFRDAINKPGYKFFFRSEDDDFGVVKEEIRNDLSILPVSENKIIAWLVALEDSVTSNDKINKTNEDVLKKPELSGTLSSHKSVSDETSSICSSRKGGIKPFNPQMDRFGSQSTLMSSDIETSSCDSRDDMSDYSTLSETTASSRFKLRDRRKERKKRRPKRGSDTTSTYSSSITDSSLSLNILTVNLNMEKYNFLGISIVGQTNDNGDGGIYIGSIMKGGAVAADGRIDPGDMLLQVNEVNFENMSNEEAVKILRDIVHQPGPITLTVAKCWDPVPDRSYFVPKNEPVRPIDPAVWASQTIAAQGCFSGVSPPYSTNLESSSASSLPESERYLNDVPLTVATDMTYVVKALRKANSGLDVKTRMWLKITIPNAFIGSDLIDWLQQRIDGLQERRAARKYASSLLKAGYIRHTVNKVTFSEQCYYVFGDYTGGGNREISMIDSNNSNSDRDSDTLGPLPTTGSAIVPPWAALHPQPPANNGYPPYHHHHQYIPAQSAAANMKDHQAIATSGLQPIGDLPHSSQNYGGLPNDIENLSISGVQRHGSLYGGAGSSGGSESRYSVRSNENRSNQSATNNLSRWEQRQMNYNPYSNTSSMGRGGFNSANNSLHRKNMSLAPSQQQQQQPTRSISAGTMPQSFEPNNESSSDLNASRLSFQRAISDPHDHFVDVI